jgi:hypothetical protein
LEFRAIALGEPKRGNWHRWPQRQVGSLMRRAISFEKL